MACCLCKLIETQTKCSGIQADAFPVFNVRLAPLNSTHNAAQSNNCATISFNYFINLFVLFSTILESRWVRDDKWAVEFSISISNYIADGRSDGASEPTTLLLCCSQCASANPVAVLEKIEHEYQAKKNSSINNGRAIKLERRF